MLVRIFSLSLLSCIVSILTIPSSLTAQTTIYWKKDYIRDSSGSTIAVATPEPTDTTVPTTPGTPGATTITTDSIAISWSGSTDNSGVVAGYIVYRGPIPVAAVTGGTFNDVGLLPNSFHSYRIVAFDAAHNYSAYSGVLNTAVSAMDTPPLNLTATAVTTTQVNLSWSAPSTGPSHHYGIYRQSNSSWAKINTTTATTFSDTTVSATTAYMYKVAAEDASNGTHGYTNQDLATTVVFTDGTITVASTVIKAVHVTELRTAVNAVRAAAGLSSSSWTNSSLSGAWIQSVDISELRSSLGAALSALGLSAPSYTDSTLTGGTTTIKRAHVEQLRQGVK